MEGYLYKSTSFFSKWDKRYFILKDNILCYFKNKGGELRGKLHLSILQIKDYDENDKKFEIDSGLTSISIRAETKEERDIWIKKIKENQHQNLMFELEYLNRNLQIFNKENSVIEEILKLQAKLDVIKNYISILENHNVKVFELVQQKGDYKNEITSITKECRVKYKYIILRLNMKIYFKK